MNRNVPKSIPVLIILWILVFTPSFAVYDSITPIGDGFTRGFNRILPFVLMQLVALLLAVLAS